MVGKVRDELIQMDKIKIQKKKKKERKWAERQSQYITWKEAFLMTEVQRKEKKAQEAKQSSPTLKDPS